MLKMLVILALTGLFSSAWASLVLHGTPLFSGETSFTFAVETSILTKKTTCYITSGEVTQCRRKRGMEELPEIAQMYGDLQIAPSAVLGIQATPVPRALGSLDFLNSQKVYGSFDDAYFNSQNIFRQLAAKGRSNHITVGDCGQSTVNLSQFLSCLGMTVQETTTLTATFTETSTLSEGYTIMTVMGCTPAGFPYLYCPAIMSDTASSSVSTESIATDTTTTIQPTSPSTEPPTSTTEASTTTTTEATTTTSTDATTTTGSTPP